MQNTSGIEPVDVRLLVQPDAPREQSKGGVFIPEATKDKEKFASVRATVIAVGENVGLDWGSTARKPAAGDRVLMAQYAGTNVQGDDDGEYRIINDADVVAVLVAVVAGGI